MLARGVSRSKYEPNEPNEKANTVPCVAIWSNVVLCGATAKRVETTQNTTLVRHWSDIGFRQNRAADETDEIEFRR